MSLPEPREHQVRGGHGQSDSEDTDNTSSDDHSLSLPPSSPSSMSTPVFSDSNSMASQDWDLDQVPSSPAPSVYSLTSSIIAQSYREEHGRKLNNYSLVYALPADEVEIARLREILSHVVILLPLTVSVFEEKQHRMFEEITGRYPPGLREVMRDEPGKTKSVVDLGCGCGSW